MQAGFLGGDLGVPLVENARAQSLPEPKLGPRQAQIQWCL